MGKIRMGRRLRVVGAARDERPSLYTARFARYRPNNSVLIGLRTSRFLGSGITFDVKETAIDL